MSNFKEKSQAFIMGLMAGLIIAGGFFIFKLDDYFKELNFYKTVAKTFSSDSKNKEVVVKLEDTEQVKEKKAKPKNKKAEVQKNSSEENSASGIDSLKTYVMDSLPKNNYTQQDEIIIKKDELLFTKTLEIVNLSPIASTVSAKDSLLQKVSGITDERSNGKQFINIEFWQSPLNYKGYKMGKYKLVLYGIASAEAIKVYKLEDQIYFKNSGITFALDYTADFKPLERVTDESIVSKLK